MKQLLRLIILKESEVYITETSWVELEFHITFLQRTWIITFLNISKTYINRIEFHEYSFGNNVGIFLRKSVTLIISEYRNVDENIGFPRNSISYYIKLCSEISAYSHFSMSNKLIRVNWT